MNRPQTWRQCPQLDTFHAATLDERNRILKKIVRVLRAVRRKDLSRRIGLAVDCFNNAHLISANFDKWNFAYHLFKRPLNKMQSWFQYIRLNTYFAFGCYYSARRHLGAEVPSL